MKSFNDSEEPTSISAPDVQKVAQTKPYPQFFSWPPFWFLILFFLVVCAVSYAAFLRYASDTRQEELKLLATIADLKVDEITRWRKERKGDAEVFARAPLFVRTFEKWLQQGAPQDENRQAFIERMKLTQRAYGYREVILFDARGQPVLSTTSGAPLPATRTMELVKRAMQTQTLIPLDINSIDVADSLDVIAPIISGSQAIGAAYLRTDISRFLFPLLQAGPADHESMELVLVRREGDEVLLLNIPAADKEAGLLRQPLNKSKLPAAMAAAGMQGEVEGVDYKGVPVFAALRKIPASDWALVTKVNQEKIYAPLREAAWLVAGVIAALIALSGLAMSLWWRNQRTKILLAEQKQAEKNLRNESAYTRSLIEASLDPLVTISAEGKILDVNKATEEATGIPRSQLIGTDFSSYFTEPGKAETGYLHVFARGFVHDYPLTLRHASGRTMDVLYNAATYKDDRGNILGVFAAARDITERKRAEEALHRSEAQLKEAQHIARIGSWDWDATTDTITWTEELYRIFDRDPDLPTPNYEEHLKLYTPESNERLNAAVGRAMKTGESYELDLELANADEHRRWVTARGETRRGANGQILGLKGTAQDITERKRAEDELRISEERLALAASTGGIGIWDWDVVADKLVWDDAMYRLYGLRRGDFGGAYEAWASALHPEDKARTEAEIQAALRGEREYAPEFRVVWPDGSIHYLKAASHTLFDGKGRPLRMVGINYDLTERKLAEQELREKEERLALATIYNGVGVWDWNLVTQEMIWDDSMYALYHIRREDFIGTEEAWRASLHPDDLERGDREVNDAIAGIKPFDTEFRVVWPDGEIRHIKAVAKVFRDGRDTPVRMLGINMDITERKRAEEALAQERLFLDTLLDNIAEAVVSCDGQGILSRFNQAARELHGLPEQPIAPDQWAEYYDLYQADGKTPLRMEEIPLFRALQGERVRDTEMTVIPKNGTARFLLASGQSLRDPGGKLFGAVVTMHDITERRQVEMALRESELFLNQSQHIAGIGSYVTDLKSGTWKISDEMYSILGIDRLYPHISEGFFALVHPDSIDELLAYHNRVESERLPFDYEYKIIRHNDKAVRWVHGLGHIENDEQLQPVRRKGTIQDITFRKQAEEKISQLNNELERRVVERTAQLEAANSDMEGFSYSVSHDLRAPLRAIDGFSHILLEDYAARLDDEGRRLLNIVGNNARKMGELIDDILMFSRTTRQEVKRSEINMESMIRDIWEELKQEMAGRNVQLELRDMPPVEGDAAMLRQVVFNLLANAVKFTKHNAGARIEVGGEANEHEVVYHVKDNGAGFNMQYAEKLFGVFHRLHGVDDFEGTGIGLAIVKRIITKHGGRVWAEGKPNEGATFYFALPKR